MNALVTYIKGNYTSKVINKFLNNFLYRGRRKYNQE